MQRQKRNKREIKKGTVLFGLGLLLFLAGVGGIMKESIFGTSFSLSTVLSSDVQWYGEVDTHLTEKLFEGQEEFQHFMQTTLDRFVVRDMDWSSWVKGDVALAKLDGEGFVLSFAPPVTKRARHFVEMLSTPEETVVRNTYNKQVYFTPAFSSPLVALDYKGHIVVASSKQVLETALFTETPLRKDKAYKNLLKDSYKKGLVHFYIRTQKTLPNVASFSKEYKPLFEALGETIPEIMVTIRPDKDILAMRINTSLSPGVYSKENAIRSGGKTLPIMARFAPKNALYFMNGSNLLQKYSHTKEFLSSLHPQFSVLFDGIMKAEVSRLLGEDFDLERDLFGLLGSQYATLVEGFDVSEGGLSFALLSQFESYDIETGLDKFHQAVRRAQGAFSLTSQEVELPDGTIREELVALDPSEVVIDKQEFAGVEYFSARTPNEEGRFSYGVVDGVFVFASQENGMKSIITSSLETDAEQGLGANSDFREGVLYHFSASESYGFLNMSRLSEYVGVWQALQGESEEGSWLDAVSFLGESVRSVVFSRKTYPDKAITDLLLFPR